MFKAEWEYLKKHKFFMLVIVVLFFVPSIYAVTFLSSLWDPYGQVKNLPVAIINKDKSVTYEGQKLAVGDDLEKELRKSKDMDFHFPSEKEAKAGLKDGKYYTVITIPSDFSKDATTLLDKDPKQMKLDYETSSGHSFIAGKLSESGAKEISQQISKQVTKTYAKTIFGEMKKVGKGMNTAADANKQLADGTTQIKSGSDQLTSGLQTLSASTLQFNDGAQTLTQGLSQYVDGVAQADSGSQQVTAGLSQLNSQVPALVGGVGQLATGSASLNDGVTQYTSGVDQVATGINGLNSGLTQYTSGVDQLATGGTALANGVDELNQQLQGQDLTGKIETLQSQIATLQSIKADMPNQTEWQNQLATAKTDLDNLAKANAADVAQVPSNLDKALADAGVQMTDAQKAKVAASLAVDASNSQTAKQMQSVITNVAALQTQMAEFMSAHGDQINQLAETAQKTDWTSVNQSLNELKSLPGAVNTIDDNMQTLSSGLNTLAGKSNELQSGTTQLTTGLDALTDKSSDLRSGSARVSSGLNTLNGKTGDLSNGASQLLAGSSQLTTGLDTLNSKRGELNSGAGQLADGARKLNGGANQLTAGAEQLSPALAKVQAGNQTLADKMGSAAKQVNDTKATNKTFKQIAAPATAKQTEKDHVANNGTGMVPYMFSVAMFVGMMALNLMLDMISPRTKISSLAAWMGSKMVMLFGIAVMAATVLYGLSISILGLDPIHPLQTYGFMILISLMDAALVTAIYMWFDKAGAFAAMVLLVFQLSGSAGTYPIQLSNAFFEWLHPYLPMTYTVDGLRETIMIGGSAMPQVEVLFSVFVVSVIAMVIYYVSHRRHYSMMQDIAEA
ncbi:YhgE/Pip domain-containing protein [Weissella confusa]|uniref:YhgE/Pip domain-containing protein n=1 Tax=Weissella confusa TaxID=1583 RepID=UPI00223C01A9|nr:YhgE/Pip domain-containing protein [Weissella confusa]MCT0949484.1 YhgE/Pip domain-containing protein [Weissella confusa]